MDFDLEHRQLAAALPAEPPALARERVAQHRPRLVPGLLGGRHRVFLIGRVRGRRLERRRGETRPEVSSAVTFQDEVAGPDELDPRRLRLPDLPQGSHLDHRRIGWARHGIERVGQDERIGLEVRIEKRVGERVLAPLAARGHGPAPQSIEQQADRLPRVRELSPIDQRAVVDPKPAGGGWLGGGVCAPNRGEREQRGGDTPGARGRHRCNVQRPFKTVTETLTLAKSYRRSTV